LLKILDLNIDGNQSEIGSCEPCTETFRVEVIQLAMLAIRRSTTIDFAEHFEPDVE
jgi:hypothetical protein